MTEDWFSGVSTYVKSLQERDMRPRVHEYTEQIQRWEDQLRAGDSVKCGPSELDKAIIVTLARRLHGQRPLPNDPLGPQAQALIDA